MTQEQTFGTALATVAAVRTAGTGLELARRRGRRWCSPSPRAEPTKPLEGTTWQLSAIISKAAAASPVAGSIVTMQISGDQLSGKACNTFRGQLSDRRQQLQGGPADEHEDGVRAIPTRARRRPPSSPGSKRRPATRIVGEHAHPEGRRRHRPGVPGSVVAIDVATDLLACPVCRSALGVADGGAALRERPQLRPGTPGLRSTSSAARSPPTPTPPPCWLRAAGCTLPASSNRSLHRSPPSVSGRMTMLEVGSGTAYYLASALGDDPVAVGVALDVSKAAARVAAQADPRIAAVVADVWRPLPVRDRCLDAVLCVFAPRNLPEFARVLRPDGLLVVATPRPGHLAGLRDRHGLLEVPADKADQLAAAASEFFELHDTTAAAATGDGVGGACRRPDRDGPERLPPGAGGRRRRCGDDRHHRPDLPTAVLLTPTAGKMGSW